MLADEKSGVAAVPVVTAQVANTTLLERLMAGSSSNLQPQPQQQQSLLNTTNLNPLAGQVPNVGASASAVSQLQGGVNGAAGESSSDITLAALLSNPTKAGGSSANSPTKMSPLLQQLQQPVQSVHSRLYGGTGSLTSPKQPPMSPRTNVTSPRSIQPAQSPRSVLPASPRQVTVGSVGSGGSSLQQQLMQPPQAPRYSVAVTTHSILSAQLSQPPRSSTAQPGLMAVTSQGLVPVSSHTQQQQQNLVQVSQGQIIQVSQAGQVLAVSQAGGGGGSMHSAQVLQQQPQGSPVQLQLNQSNPTGMVSVSLADLVNNSNNSSAVNGTMSHGGIVTLGQMGQVQLVNQSIPVQLSIPGHNQPITFSVSLPDNQQQQQQQHHQVGGVSNGAVNQPMLVSAGANNTAKPGSVTMTSVGKLVNGPGGAGTVVLQGPSGNIIHLPSQQGVTPQGHAQYTSIKPAPTLVQNNLIRNNQVVVRPGQPNSLLVQMPSTGGGAINQHHQPIQIVRSMPGINQQQLAAGGTLQVQAMPSQQQVKGMSMAVASPSPQGPATPGIPPSPISAVTSPQGIMGAGPESPMVVQLQNHGGAGSDGSPHHFVISNQKTSGSGGVGGQPLTAAQLLNNQTLNSQAAHLKMRQQRKQSLK